MIYVEESEREILCNVNYIVELKIMGVNMFTLKDQSIAILLFGLKSPQLPICVANVDWGFWGVVVQKKLSSSLNWVKGCLR